MTPPLPPPSPPLVQVQVQQPTAWREKARPETMALLGFEAQPDGVWYLSPPHLRCPKCIEARAPCYIRPLQAVHNHNPSNGHGVFLWARLACRDCYWGRGGRGSCPYNMDKASFRIDCSEDVPANRLKLVSTLETDDELDSSDDDEIRPPNKRTRPRRRATNRSQQTKGTVSTHDVVTRAAGRLMRAPAPEPRVSSPTVYTVKDSDDENESGTALRDARGTRDADDDRLTTPPAEPSDAAPVAAAVPDSDSESDLEAPAPPVLHVPLNPMAPSTQPRPKLDYGQVGQLTAKNGVVPATIVESYLKLLAAADPGGFMYLAPSVLKRDGNQAFWTVEHSEKFNETPHTVVHPVLFDERWCLAILWPPMHQHRIYVPNPGGGVNLDKAIRKLIGMKTIELFTACGPAVGSASTHESWGSCKLIPSDGPEEEGNGGVLCLAVARTALEIRITIASLQFKKNIVDIGRRIAADLIGQRVGAGCESLASVELGL